MALGRIEVHAGDFRIGDFHQLARDILYFYGRKQWNLLMDVGRGSFAREKIPLTEITALQIVSEESLNQLRGALGWGLAGKMFLGPVGELAGLMRGGRGQRITFACSLRDGRRFLASTSAAVFYRLRTSLAVAEFQDAPGLLPDKEFDKHKWAELVQYDQEIAKAVEEVRFLGPHYVDKLASTYLALNDKRYLPGIVAKILAVNADHESNNPELHNPLTKLDTAKLPRAKARVSSIVAWCYVSFAGLGGLALTTEGDWSGFPMILSAAVALPYFPGFILNRFGLALTGWLRLLVIFGLFTVAAAIHR